MKNTFIILLFIFWGFIIAIISAGYIVKQNRLSQESMQKIYTESTQEILNSLVKATLRDQQVVSDVPVPQKNGATVPGTKTVNSNTNTVTPQAQVVPSKPVVVTPKPVAPSGPTLTTVAVHNTESDCWVVVNDKVYSVASYIPMHPGGSQRIANVCGGDATLLFNGIKRNRGHSSYANSLLGQYLVGTLQ